MLTKQELEKEISRKHMIQKGIITLLQQDGDNKLWLDPKAKSNIMLL